MRKKAVVLLSGGIDSSTTLYWALNKGYECHCLIFDYAQRHRKEVGCAKKIARMSGSSYRTVKLNFPWKGSSLVDRKKKIPRKVGAGIPSTYVPARNSIFLSVASGYAETIKAGHVFFGANVIDYSGYPDCRPAFIKKFQEAINLGIKGTPGRRLNIRAPLLKKKKTEIIALAQKLRVPIGQTWSCYRAGKTPCGQCPSCRIRAKAFKKLKLKDPLDKR